MIRDVYGSGSTLPVSLALETMGLDIARARFEALMETLRGNSTLSSPAWWSGDDGETLRQLDNSAPAT